MELLKVKNVSKTFNGIHALENLSFSIKKGEVVGLIGPNGSGKSTFFNILMNSMSKDSGSIEFHNEDINQLSTDQIVRKGISRNFQDGKTLAQITVRENMDLSFKYRKHISLKNVFFNSKQLKNEEADNLKKIKNLLDSVGIVDKYSVLAKNLSYGQGKVLEILKIMISDAELILLDEPFSGLFHEMIKVIQGLIVGQVKAGKTIILVEHNMQLIQEICDTVIVLDAGRKIAEGPFAKVIKEPIVIESYLGK